MLSTATTATTATIWSRICAWPPRHSVPGARNRPPRRCDMPARRCRNGGVVARASTMPRDWARRRTSFRAGLPWDPKTFSRWYSRCWARSHPRVPS